MFNDDVNELIESTSGEHHIRAISHLSWVQVDHNRYILSNNNGSFLTIWVNERNFVVTATQKVPKQSDDKWTPFMKPSTLATTSTFEDAVHAADTYAKAKFLAPWILTTALWRRAPATPEQINFLNRFREEGKKLELGSVTKGRAADWITKIKHGARGRLKRMHTQKAKVERAKNQDERLKEMQSRMRVKVGPLNDPRRTVQPPQQDKQDEVVRRDLNYLRGLSNYGSKSNDNFR